MLTNSNLRILERTPSELVAYDPPYPIFGVFFVLFGLVCLVVLLFVARKTGWMNVYLAGFAAAAAFAAIGVGVMTSVTYYRFARSDGQLTITGRLFGIDSGVERIPLSDLDHAEVETSKNTRRIVIVRHSGPLLFLTSSTDREGYYELKDAINEFLGKRSFQ